MTKYTFLTRRDHMCVAPEKALLWGPVNGQICENRAEDTLQVMGIIEAAWELDSTQAVVAL